MHLTKLEDLLNQLITNHKSGYAYISNTRKLLEFLNSNDVANIYVCNKPDVTDKLKTIINECDNDDDYKDYVKFYTQVKRLLED